MNEDSVAGMVGYAGGPIEPRHIPLLTRLKQQREEVQRKLDEFNEAIKALESNPEFEKLINTLGKVTRI